MQHTVCFVCKNVCKTRKAYHIPISKSRNVYGVADLSRKLKKNECFIQVTEHADHHDQLSQENRHGFKVSALSSKFP